MWARREVNLYNIYFCSTFYQVVYFIELTSLSILQRRYACEQVKNCYGSFTMQFDQLQDHQVIWEPYHVHRVQARYPGGISSLCRRDENYWMTQARIVFDVTVEEMSQQRVMRQFGKRQLPVPPARLPRLPAYIHK